jgi:hypothetical protein
MWVMSEPQGWPRSLKTFQECSDRPSRGSRARVEVPRIVEPPGPFTMISVECLPLIDYWRGEGYLFFSRGVNGIKAFRRLSAAAQ